MVIFTSGFVTHRQIVLFVLLSLCDLYSFVRGAMAVACPVKGVCEVD